MAFPDTTFTTGTTITSNWLNAVNDYCLNNPTVSVKDFGAVGDGVTDDTQAIQDAIDAVYDAGGGTVNAPAGTYKCNIELKQGVNLQGVGKGLDANLISGIPQTPNYTFVAGGTTLIPADRTLPVVKLSGSGNQSNWPNCSIKDLKITDNGGALVANTVGILAELTQNIRIDNVMVSVMDTGIQLGGTGKTTWGYTISNTSVWDCGSYGIKDGQPSSNATPNYFSNVDIRRCTGSGLYLTQTAALCFVGGTLADNEIGAELSGSGQGFTAITFYNVQFETNFTTSVKYTGSAYENVSFIGCQFSDFRCSNGDGTVFPIPYTGSINITYNANSTANLSLYSCTFTSTDVCISYSGSGKITSVTPTVYSCNTFVTGLTQATDTVLRNSDFVSTSSTKAVSLGNNRLSYKTDDFTTYANNFLLQPAKSNAANISGLITNGTATFSQWVTYAGSDPDNTNYASLEASSTYCAINSGKNGTGTTKELRLGTNGNSLIRLSPSSQIGFFGQTGTTKPTVTGAKGGNAALDSLLQALDGLGLIQNSTT